MPSRAVFIPNPGFSAEMEGDPEFQAGLREHAEQEVVPHVEAQVSAANGPWMPRKGHKPVEVVEAEGRRWANQHGSGVTGGAVYVVLTEHGGHLMEYGSKNNPPHAPLRKGVMAAGMDVQES
jgi:hypothetical protein